MQEVWAKIESFKTFKKESHSTLTKAFSKSMKNVFFDSIIHDVMDGSNCFTYKAIFNVTCVIMMNNGCGRT